MPSYSNAIHVNRYEHSHGNGSNHTQGMNHVHSRTSSSTGSNRRNSSVEFPSNEILRKSPRNPPQTSALLASASSALQAKKILHTLYHQKPPLSPTSIRYTNNKYDYSSRSTQNTPTKDKEKMKEKEKEKLNDNNSIDSQSEDNVSEEEETTKTESEFSKNKGKRQSYNSYFASSSTAHRSLHETFNDKDNSNTKNNNNQGVKDKESKGKEKDEGEEGEEGITENYPAIHSFDDSDKIPTSAKGTKSSSQTANLHTHPYTHNHHSVTKTKVNSPTSAKSPTVFSPFTTEIPSTSGSTSHRSGVRPPSINTNKLGLSSSISQNANTIEYPTSAPIRSNHPTTLMGSVYPPSAITPLHINGDSVNAYTNMILSAQSPTSTKDKVHSHHHNFAFLGNKHILRRKKSNIVRSAASFPNLSHVKN